MISTRNALRCCSRSSKLVPHETVPLCYGSIEGTGRASAMDFGAKNDGQVVLVFEF